MSHHDRSEKPDDIVAGVEVRIPATPAQLSTLRAVAADLAMRHDFDLDAIADLRMAVDEAATTLIGRAAENTALTCHFVPDDHGIAVSVSVRSTDGGALRKDTFSWRVLRTLADTVQVEISQDEAGSGPHGGGNHDSGRPTHRVRIDLVKRHHGAVTG